MSGKGGKRRPRQVTREEFDARWAATFTPRDKPTHHNCACNGDSHEGECCGRGQCDGTCRCRSE